MGLSKVVGYIKIFCQANDKGQYLNCKCFWLHKLRMFFVWVSDSKARADVFQVCVHKLGVVTGLGKGQDVAVRTEGMKARASSRNTGSFLGYFSFLWLTLKSHPNPREENALLRGFGVVYFYLVDGTHVCLGALVCRCM